MFLFEVCLQESCMLNRGADYSALLSCSPVFHLFFGWEEKIVTLARDQKREARGGKNEKKRLQKQ